RSLEGTGSISGAGGVIYMSRAILACDGGALQVRADSLVLYEAQRIYHLMGNVFFETDEVRVRSATAEYYAASDLIRADGAVDLLRKSDGTAITGGEELEYFLPGGVAGAERLTVSGGRPHAVLHPTP